MSALRRLLAPVPLRRQAWWLVWSLLGGWFVVYNIARVAGSEAPREAALPSLPLGLALGVVIFVAYVAVFRALARRELVHAAPGEPRALSESAARTWARPLVAGAVVLAAVAAIVGAVLLVQWLGADSAERSKTKLAIAAWDLLVAAWFAAELPALNAMARGSAEPSLEPLDGLPLGGLVTAVLASVGVARDLFPGGQIVLIVAGGAVAALAYLAMARIAGRRGAALPVAGAIVVTALALVLPLVG